MKKLILVLALVFAFAIAGKAFAAQSIALTGTLPAGAQGLTASNGNSGVGVVVLEGLGYLFTVKLLTLHF